MDHRRPAMRRMQPRSCFIPALAVALAALGSLAPAGASHAQTASALIHEGTPLPEAGDHHVVTSFGSTTVSHVGGYAVGLNSTSELRTLSHVWGSVGGSATSILRTEATYGDLVQTSFEGFQGLSDAGSIAYSANGQNANGIFDSVWLDDTPLAVGGEPVASLPGMFWRFASRAGISADGIPYWIGGIADTPGGLTQNRGLFLGIGADPVFLGGDILPGVPGPLDAINTVSFDHRYSAMRSHLIAQVQIVAGPSENGVMTVDGAGLLIEGELVRETALIPAAAGGIGAEAWATFKFTGITESGNWFFTGNSNGNPATNDFIVRNGAIQLREGDMVGGEILSGSIEGAYMNENSDLAFIWDIEDNTREALFVSIVGAEQAMPAPMLLVAEGDEVDLDADGMIDAGAVLTDFTGQSALSLSDRVDGLLRVYFTAEIDTAGTPSSVDDIEGYFRVQVPLGTTTVESIEPAPRTSMLLSAAAPNPFASETMLRFTLNQTGRTRLTVYDVSGRLVNTILDATLSAGPHAVRWDRGAIVGGDLPSGAYFYRLEQNGTVKARKMILLEN